ncbi:CBS domain-containing protein [Bacillus horti]|uniref:CBS domain-containing protein n=1 Tax=Caldalkalibacillus horti TaxID=77523 RepID=A0ABT9W2M4_9BACI|nr:CBS domain-containing protein [Bacillus horti]MDQ0167486.1 CBS domain-containing protein [Bacillus horti]
MNVAFFLLPKEEVVYIHPESTMRQALEKLDYHRYTALPIIDQRGKYVATLTEGDLLRRIKEAGDLTFEKTDQIRVHEIAVRKKIKPVPINADMGGLISLAVEQNFVPVVDDNKVFIGIIRRREIINYCYNQFLVEGKQLS